MLKLPFSMTGLEGAAARPNVRLYMVSQSELRRSSAALLLSVSVCVSHPAPHLLFTGTGKKGICVLRGAQGALQSCVK